MTDEQSLINEVFEKYLGSSFSKEARQKVAQAHGEEIASQVKVIYEDALHTPVDWRTASLDTALPVLHDLLNNKYPWLSAEARKNLNYAFIMAWK